MDGEKIFDPARFRASLEIFRYFMAHGELFENEDLAAFHMENQEYLIWYIQNSLGYRKKINAFLILSTIAGQKFANRPVMTDEDFLKKYKKRRDSKK